jgi:glucokinase
VADVGGTHARLALWTADAGLHDAVRLSNDDYPGPLELLEEWFRRWPDQPRRVVLALAMPIDADAGQLTNRAWRFDPALLRAALRLDALVIVNDFAAAAAGVDALRPADARLLNPVGTSPLRGTRLVLGPGTGLGTAAIVAGTPPRILASEAGHMTFSSAHPIASQLLAIGRPRWGRVSWERVLCGDGLVWLHAVASRQGGLLTPASVAGAAEAGDRQAVETVRLFSRLLGEFAGDVCLAFQALEGVYLAGGVLHGLARSFDATAFLASFTDKGRLSDRLRQVPVHLATGHELGLNGAARFLAGRCRMPSMEWRA